MAGNGDDVFGFEDGCLLENLAADFGEGEAVGGGIEILEATGVLDGLERNAADTRLLKCVVNSLADFVVVQTFLQRDNQRGRDVVAVQLLEGIDADAAQVGAS